MTAISASLGDVDRNSEPRSARIKWVVADTEKRKNDFFVLFRPKIDPSVRDPESAERPMSLLIEGAATLVETPELPMFYSNTTVSRVLTASKRGEGVEKVSVALMNGKVRNEVVLDDAFKENARKAIREAQDGWGAVVGVLDILDARHGKGELRASLVDEVAKRAVTVTVPSSRAELLKDNWGKRVRIAGPIKRNDRHQVVRMELENLESWEQYGARPMDVEGMVGIAPDWCDGMDPVDWVQRIRRTGDAVRGR